MSINLMAEVNVFYEETRILSCSFCLISKSSNWMRARSNSDTLIIVKDHYSPEESKSACIINC